jgi:hypothetical protein
MTKIKSRLIEDEFFLRVPEEDRFSPLCVSDERSARIKKS